MRRLATAVAQLFAVVLIVFIVLRAIPGDSITSLLPPNATPEDAQALIRALGLDLPVWQQFLLWLRAAVSGDLGLSIQARTSVSGLILDALPMTLELVISGLGLGIVLGIGMGLLAFRWRGTLGERVIDVINNVAQSIPGFLWGLLLILTFCVAWQVMPSIGPIDPDMVVPRVTGLILIDALVAGDMAAFISRLEHMILPAVAIAMTKAPTIVRVLRSSLLEVYNEPFIEYARLRGVDETRVLIKHAFRNAALPTISLLGVQAGYLFGGTLLIEGMYSLPGLGGLTLAAIRTHDIPLIQGVTLTYCIVVLALNALVDVAYLALNPRLRPS
ncbi:ABC transporter permease [soil metagenome]